MKQNRILERQQAHTLLDLLPEKKLHAVCSLLEVMVAPLSRSRSPLEDEQMMQENTAVPSRTESSQVRDKGITHEDILRELSLEP